MSKIPRIYSSVTSFLIATCYLIFLIFSRYTEARFTRNVISRPVRIGYSFSPAVPELRALLFYHVAINLTPRIPDKSTTLICFYLPKERITGCRFDRLRDIEHFTCAINPLPRFTRMTRYVKYCPLSVVILSHWVNKNKPYAKVMYCSLASIKSYLQCQFAYYFMLYFYYSIISIILLFHYLFYYFYYSIIFLYYFIIVLFDVRCARP